MSKTKDKRQNILDSALDLFVKKGYHQTRTSEISEKAKIAAGTLFNYFPKKEELLNTLYEEVKDELFTEVFTPKEPDEHIYAFLKKVWMNLVMWGIKNYNKILFIIQMEDSPIVSEELKVKIEAKLAGTVVVYQEAVKQGFIKDIPLGMGMSLFYYGGLSTIKYLVKFESKASEAKLKKLAEQGFEGYLYGMRK